MARERKDLLLDLVREARDVQAFIAGCDPKQFEGDRMRQKAVLCSLGNISEALKRLDDSTRASLAAAGIPLRDIAAMRNLFTHEYWRTDVELLWKTATEDMEPLLAAVAPLLPVIIEPNPPEGA